MNVKKQKNTCYYELFSNQNWGWGDLISSLYRILFTGNTRRPEDLLLHLISEGRKENFVGGIMKA